jgi:hypothetical protein
LTSEHELEVLLRLCPEVVIGKHVAITSIDSGFLHLTINSANELPQCGFDEWYVLDDQYVSLFRDATKGTVHCGA